MQTRDELIKNNTKYKRTQFRWFSPNHMVKTCAFSDEYREMNYMEYLSKWANRMNEDYRANSEEPVLDDRFIIIKHWRNKMWLICLIELED
jgi:hypothetical protein